jgi:uncharacterized protein
METTHPSTTATTRLADRMRAHPLFFFFLLAYLFSWIMIIPFILAQWHLIPGDWTLAFTLNAFAGPFLSAYIMSRVTGGKDAVRKLFRSSIFQWREGWLWYAFVLLGIPALWILGIIVLPGALASFTGVPTATIISYPLSYIPILLFGGPLGEEPGWRGFALPRMQARWGALKGTLLLGVLWTFWHLPHFLTIAQRGGPGVDYARLMLVNLPIFFGALMCLTIIMSWVYNHTHGSLWMALLLHASINAFGGAVTPLFPAAIVQNSDLCLLAGLALPAVLILTLTRGKLGYSG